MKNKPYKHKEKNEVQRGRFYDIGFVYAIVYASGGGKFDQGCCQFHCHALDRKGAYLFST